MKPMKKILSLLTFCSVLACVVSATIAEAQAPAATPVAASPAATTAAAPAAVDAKVAAPVAAAPATTSSAAPAAAPTPNKGDVAWMLTATALVLLMSVPALALFYGGLVRSKNMLSVLMQVFVTFSLITVL